MKLGSISPMNFKGIYEVSGQKTDLNPKNVPAGDWEKGNEDLTYVNLTYRIVRDEKRTVRPRLGSSAAMKQPNHNGKNKGNVS